MSPLRIIIGLLIGICLSAGVLAAAGYFSMPAQWIPIAICIVVCLPGGMVLAFRRLGRLQPYWDRACTGFQWRRRFPDTPKSDIRRFLELFVDAFAFRQSRRLCFSPDDKVMDVYRTLYPDRFMADALELETLASLLRERYGIDAAAFWREEYTW
jgi:hypothetical protein